MTADWVPAEDMHLIGPGALNAADAFPHPRPVPDSDHGVCDAWIARLGKRAETAEAEREELILARMSRSVKLARIAAHCRQRLDGAVVQGPVSDLCRDILAIIGSEEEARDV